MIKLPRYVFWLALLVCWPSILFGQPMFVAKTPTVRIVLYDEPCALQEVTNLKLRAVWTEDGKDFEGCWAANEGLRVVLAYFSDKTVAAVPIAVFERVTGV